MLIAYDELKGTVLRRGAQWIRGLCRMALPLALAQPKSGAAASAGNYVIAATHKHKHKLP